MPTTAPMSLGSTVIPWVSAGKIGHAVGHGLGARWMAEGHRQRWCQWPFSSIHLRMNWKPAFLPRHLPTEMTRPSSMVMMGLMPSRPPTTAVAPRSARPSSGTLTGVHHSQEPHPSGQLLHLSLQLGQGEPLVPEQTGGLHQRPMPKVTVWASTTAMLLSSTMPWAIMADW